MVEIMQFLQIVVGLIAALILFFSIPYVKRKSSIEQATEQQTTSLSEWVTIAVVAAEQIYAGPGRGEEKKAYVIEFLVTKGYMAGMNSISEEIDALIEASVCALKK